jgi:hypothetical protein
VGVGGDIAFPDGSRNVFGLLPRMARTSVLLIRTICGSVNEEWDCRTMAEHLGPLSGNAVFRPQLPLRLLSQLGSGRN